MKWTKIAIISLILLFFLGIGIVIYGKKNIKHISYEEYKIQSTYNITEKDKYKSYYPELENFYIEPKEAKDLIENTEEIVIATAKQLILYGNSILTQYEVTKKIKGEIQIGEKINVYENIVYWNLNETLYLSGLTPVEKENSYLLFLKQSPSPSISHTYTYSTLTYGHIHTSNNRILENYSNNSKTIQEISQYDYVFAKDTSQEEINKYQKIKEEILDWMTLST